MSSELSHSVVTSDDCSQSTDDDFDDQPSPAELSNLFKVTFRHCYHGFLRLLSSVLVNSDS